MNKTFKFTTKNIELDFDIKMDIELLSTDKKYIFVEFSSNTDDLIISHKEDVLSIKDKNAKILNDNVKSVKGFMDVIMLALDNKMHNKDSKYEGNAKIYIPDSQVSISLKANDAVFNAHADIETLTAKFNACKTIIHKTIHYCDMKINAGSIKFNQSINTCNIKGNSAKIKSKASINHLNLKLNSGHAKLYVDDSISFWEIKSNNADITLNNHSKTDIKHNKTAYKVGDGVINIKTNGMININKS